MRVNKISSCRSWVGRGVEVSCSPFQTSDRGNAGNFGAAHESNWPPTDSRNGGLDYGNWVTAHFFVRTKKVMAMALGRSARNFISPSGTLAGKLLGDLLPRRRSFGRANPIFPQSLCRTCRLELLESPFQKHRSHVAERALFSNGILHQLISETRSDSHGHRCFPLAHRYLRLLFRNFDANRNNGLLASLRS